MYSLDRSIKSFAVSNDFVVTTNKACYNLGKQLAPFCIYANDKQKEYGVIDIAEFGGMLDENKMLVDEIAEMRLEAYKLSGVAVDEALKKTLFYDYLMSISACYVEIPKYVTKNGQAQSTYDKFLCTKNPAIMAAWMGCQPSEMQAKYSSRISGRYVEFQLGELRAVKLQHSAKGNSISVPRNAMVTEKMVCIPMYMIYAFIEGFKPMIQDGIVNFTFLKDNGTVRELATTVNEGILMDYYDDNMFVSTMLSGVDINTVQQGGMQLSSKMNRGYIKVPELGASIYDGSGVRSLNLARILKAEKVSEVDRSFIKVDLNSVVANFIDSMDYMYEKMPDELKKCYVQLTGEVCESDSVVSIMAGMKYWVESRSTFLSTTFHRQLHKFMIGNPQWFPLYTGMPNQNIVSSQNCGVMPMDF